MALGLWIVSFCCVQVGVEGRRAREKEMGDEGGFPFRSRAKKSARGASGPHVRRRSVRQGPDSLGPLAVVAQDGAAKGR